MKSFPEKASELACYKEGRNRRLDGTYIPGSQGEWKRLLKKVYEEHVCQFVNIKPSMMDDTMEGSDGLAQSCLKGSIYRSFGEI